MLLSDVCLYASAILEVCILWRIAEPGARGRSTSLVVYGSGYCSGSYYKLITPLSAIVVR